MEFLEPILDRMPLWILIMICVLWAVNKFFYPFYDKYADNQMKSFADCAKKLDELSIKIDELIVERDDLKSELAGLHGSLNVLNQVLLSHGINIKL